MLFSVLMTVMLFVVLFVYRVLACFSDAGGSSGREGAERVPAVCTSGYFDNSPCVYHDVRVSGLNVYQST